MTQESVSHDLHPETLVMRFSGDSGDGIQTMGARFTLETALQKNGFTTFPDYPAEIRAPHGTTFGVSSYQIHFANRQVLTSGDHLDVLVAFNPAALKVNLGDLKEGGLLILDKSSFQERALKKVGYENNPLEDGTLAPYRVVMPDIDRYVGESLKDIEGLSKKDMLRAKNMWILGLILWMYGRNRHASKEWIKSKFSHKPEVMEANLKALDAGHAFGETSELTAYRVSAVQSDYDCGTFRTITGAEGVSLGLMTGSHFVDRPMVFCSYPITPSSPILHILAKMEEHGLTTFQCEDEIAAACAAIGASYAGHVGVTASSGPGVALKSEALGLAVAVELPLVIVSAQRGGPSTGLPTKTEQSDLLQVMFGRHGDAPMPVLAAKSPGDCFKMAMEAMQIAVKYMTPVMLLTDGYLQNTSEPWCIPSMDDLASLYKLDPNPLPSTEEYQPYMRDDKTLARPWVPLGTSGYTHRLGGLERNEGGNVSYDGDNHQRMTNLRHEKIERVAEDIPEQTIECGARKGQDFEKASLAVVSWGSPYGAVKRAVLNLEKEYDVSHVHISYLRPFPRGLKELLSKFDKILVVEMNVGQLHFILQSYLARSCLLCSQVTGKPFKVETIEERIVEVLNSKT